MYTFLHFVVHTGSYVERYVVILHVIVIARVAQWQSALQFVGVVMGSIPIPGMYFFFFSHLIFLCIYLMYMRIYVQCIIVKIAPVAQWVERTTFNRRVAGSIPARCI